MSKFWILVSDSSRARIFTSETASSRMVEFKDLAHPESRLHSRDITSDLPGKLHSTGSGGHHAADSKTDAHKQAGVEFARELAGYLHKNLNENRYNTLVLVCDPAFLGELRHELDDEVKKHVTLEVTKNLLKHTAEDIRALLPKILPS